MKSEIWKMGSGKWKAESGKQEMNNTPFATIFLQISCAAAVAIK